MRFYIATRLENHAEHNRLRDALAALGHKITYDWTRHGAVWRRGMEVIEEVAKSEARGVLEADEVIVLWPGGRGTHVEMGIAIGAGIPISFVSDVAEHHAASPETCAFYHHPTVRRHSSLEHYLAGVEPVLTSEVE